MKKITLLWLCLLLSYSAQAQAKWETVFQKADSLQKRQIYRDAIPILEGALALSEKEFGKTSEQYLKTRNYQGFSKIFVESKRQTEEFLKDNKQLIEQALTPKHSLYAYALYNLAIFYSVTENIALAEGFCRQTVMSSKESLGEQSSLYRKSAKRLGDLCRRSGKLIEAEQWLKGVLQIEKTTLGEKHLDYIVTINFLGVLYSDMGQYIKSETYYKEHTQLIKQYFGEKHPEYAKSIANLAGLYSMLGNRKQAEQLYKQAMTILKVTSGEKTPDYALLINNLAIVNMANGDYTEAEQLYKQSLEIRKEQLGTQSYDYLTTYKNLADLYTTMGLYFKAEKMYLESIETLKKQGDSYMHAFGVVGLSSLYRFVGRYKESKELLEEVLRSGKGNFGEKHYFYNTASVHLSTLHVQMGNYEAAGASFIKSRALSHALIRQNFSFMSEQEKTDYFNNQIKVLLDNFSSFAVEQNKYLAEAYDTQLFTKGILLASTQKMKNRLLNSKDTVVVQKYKQWNALKSAVSKYSQLTKEELAQKNISLDSLETASNNLEKELSLLSESFASLADAKEITWKDVQAKLKNKEAAIEIVRIKHSGIVKTVTDTSDLAKAPNFPQYKLQGSTDTVYYAALIVKKNSKQPELVLLKNGNELEDKYILYQKNMIEYKEKDMLSYDQFWKPIAENLKGIKKVYFSPDGVYNQVSLNTLQNPKTKKYLLQEIQLHLVSNTKDILAFGKNTNVNLKAELLGYPIYDTQRFQISDPAQRALVADTTRAFANFQQVSLLPGTKQEVENISKILFSGRYQVEALLAEKATEENIKGIQSPKLLHLSTHGFFVDKREKNEKIDPMLRSGLLLTGVSDYTRAEIKPDTEDGIL
ncbi:MAG: CHAT domain-containing protein, partial [Cytophagales bacterium]